MAPLLVRVLFVVACLSAAGCARRKPVPPSPPDAGVAAAVRDAGAARSVADVVIVGSSGLGSGFADEAGRARLARRATGIDRLRVTHVPGAVIVVDGGDLVGANAATAKTALLAFARMGGAALVPGEAELALGVPTLRSLAAAAKVPVLAANLVDARGKRPFEAHTILETPHARVGVFGIVASAPPRGFTTGDPIEAAASEAAALKAAGADAIVAIVHGDASAVAHVRGPTVVAAAHGEAGADAWNLDDMGRLNVLELARVDGPIDAGPSTWLTSPRRIEIDDRWRQQHGTRVLLTVAMGGPPEMRRKDPPPEDWTYGSSGACALCHAEETAQWKGTAHADALDTLGKRADDPACTVCHTTSFLLPGGTQYLATAKKYFPAVGCESCHGPSVAHVRAPKKPGGTSRTVAPEVCLGCHTPDQLAEPFDVARQLPKILGPGHGR